MYLKHHSHRKNQPIFTNIRTAYYAVMKSLRNR